MASIQSGLKSDVLIIGGGILGLASAYYATARGLSTLVIEKYGVQNEHNSSKGVERMFRLMQDNAQETRLAQASLALWEELQKTFESKLLAMDDLLFFGHRDAPMTTEGNVSQIKQTMDAMGLPYEYLDSPAAIHRRFPIFNRAGLADDYVGMVQSASASIDAQAAAANFLSAARRTGRLQLLEGQPVTRVERGHRLAGDAEYRIYAGSGTDTLMARGKYLIACPGVWADSVLQGLGLQQSAAWKIWQMNYAYWPLLRKQPRMPIWFEFGNVEASDHGTFYGFPHLDFSPSMRNMVKMSADYTYDVFDRPGAITTASNHRLLDELSRHLGGLIDRQVIDADHYNYAGTCLYSMSPDGKMVVGKIPEGPAAISCHPHAAMCIMESGRGFKYAPLFGRVLVELAVDGCSSHDVDLELFSPHRPGLFRAF